MSNFQNGDNEDDELFDLFILNEIHKESITNRKGGNGSKGGGSGGCLMSLLLMLSVPIGFIIGVVAIFT